MKKLQNLIDRTIALRNETSRLFSQIPVEDDDSFDEIYRAIQLMDSALASLVYVRRNLCKDK